MHCKCWDSCGEEWWRCWREDGWRSAAYRRSDIEEEVAESLDMERKNISSGGVELVVWVSS